MHSFLPVLKVVAVAEGVADFDTDVLDAEVKLGLEREQEVAGTEVEILVGTHPREELNVGSMLEQTVKACAVVEVAAGREKDTEVDENLA